MKFVYVIKYKKIITNLFIYFLIFYLIINSKIVFNSISASINIFIYKLIPALFIYILITELIINSGKDKNLSLGFSKILSKLFKIPTNTTPCVIIGFLLGYPNSAKYIQKLYERGEINSKTATKLVAFTSNANLAYIISTVGISMYNNINIGIILAISHFLSAILIGMFLTPSNLNINSIIQQTNINSNSFKQIYSPFELLYISIKGTLKTLAFIFSYTVLFSLIPIVIINKLNLTELLNTLLIGICELSNGINSISMLNIDITLKLVLTSFVLSFSSFMIIVQIFSFVYKVGVRFIDLVKYKLLQGVLSSIITYIIISFIYTPAFSVFINIEKATANSNYLTTTTVCPSTVYMLSIICSITLTYLLFRKKRQE